MILTRRLRGCVGACAALAITSTPVTQAQFGDLHKRHLPRIDLERTADVALLDVDGDGDLDLVTANTDVGGVGQNRLYLNDGAGVFVHATAGRMPFDDDATQTLTVGDVDGDGDPDLLFGNDGQNRLYLNDGGGVFTDVTAARVPIDFQLTTSLALGDVDGDGDLDLLAGNRDGAVSAGYNALLLNDGTGAFAGAPAGRLPAVRDQTRAVEFADVDGDGDLDLIVGNAGQNRLYRNDGAGTFTDATAASLPADGDEAFALAVADLDGDGDRDLVVGNGWGSGTPTSRLYFNDGSGRFTDVTPGRLPNVNASTLAVAAGDLDGDGDADLVLGNGGLQQPRQNRVYLNDGAGRFTDVTAARMPPDDDVTGSVALGDVDGDRDVDLVSGNGWPTRLYLNDGAARFTDTGPDRMPIAGNTGSAVLADLDGDGDSDLFLAGGARDRLLVNDGAGGFADATDARLPAAGYPSNAAASGDVDGDGDADLVLASFGRQNRLYVNGGNGAFTDVTASRMPVDAARDLAVELADVDGDRDLDIVLAHWNGQNRLLRNDGRGTFTDATAGNMPADADRSDALAVGDVDGDGDADVVFGNTSLGAAGRGRNRLYLNDGAGRFSDASAANLPPDDDATRALALGDVDGDGDLDLVLANAGPDGLPAGRQNRLYLNDGNGRFADATAARLPSDGDESWAVALGDVDEDGDLDALFGSHGSTLATVRARLYLNDGAGVFTDATVARLPHDSRDTSAVALGDLDGDGDLDVFFGKVGLDRSYLNLLRHLDAPFLAVAGRQYRLDAYARNGAPGAFDVALPYLAANTARIPLPPLGTLGLDPASIVPLPAFLVPQPGGVGSLTLPVPNDPNLVGRPVHAQALLVRWPAWARLTNVTSDRIAR